MKSTRKSILEQMAGVERMERGKLCSMRGGRYYNLQSWEGGRNLVRYVPASDLNGTYLSTFRTPMRGDIDGAV